MAPLLFCSLALLFSIHTSTSSPHLHPFVDKLLTLPSHKAYRLINGTFKPGALTIGMYHKKWRFHRDLPPTDVFAFGSSAKRASVPGPTIEAVTEVQTRVRWENHLPSHHIFKIDPTLNAPTPSYGVPTVVHLHGGQSEPASDGHSFAWFTAGFQSRGPAWKQEVYEYYNGEGHSNLWYHDHAVGLTRLNILAGLMGAYIIRNPYLEAPFRLPSGRRYDIPLLIFDRSFNRDGSIYTDPKGDNPKIHPEWQPEYFGDVILVNGKAWPYLHVRRRKYRFRITNAANSRFFQIAFDDENLHFIQIGSDAFYLEQPVETKQILLGPSEIADVVVDFSHAAAHEAILTNTAPYPFPDGDPTNERNGRVMKFIVDQRPQPKPDPAKLPWSLVPVRRLKREEAVRERYITLYEFTSRRGQPTHSLINFLPFEAPATETPKQGTTELWHIINLTDDNHPLHIHLVAMQVQGEIPLSDAARLGKCMERLQSAEECHAWKHAVRGGEKGPPQAEAGWKNVYKMKPAHLTTALVRFSPTNAHAFPFNASAPPGYVYHCHILEHEDNNMMRPFTILP